MTDDEMNPNICSSALEEDGTLDRTKGEDWGKHRWSQDTCGAKGCKGILRICEECGAMRDCDIEFS